ncbi:MAG: hypothetical protein GWO41_01375 [candidate division Zixibacteria bacterium]|nr:hypothetical protein [candidate division Zixibacteria bacterium]NIR63808.1 hypothetical protein [candidate division Zixibacteria bacterium]NIS14905.1 hypothetical protein [candidate division Zixibacteria bacterium]NIS45766.1 hypothetical protein [candidate division Zixibacteria bacterium]NIT51424.1 hypothetical protein [candidate division Zixibacteria bacterium]
MPRKSLIKNLFKYRPGIPRWAALALAGILVFLFFDGYANYAWSESSLGIAYFWVFLIPLIPLVVHIIYPTKIGWYLIFSIIIVYLILIGHRDFVRASWDTYHVKYAEDFQTGIVIKTVIAVLIAAAIFFFFRPRGKNA